MNCSICFEPIGKFSMSGLMHEGKIMFFCHWHGIIMRVWNEGEVVFEKAWCYQHFPDELGFFSDYQPVEWTNKYARIAHS
jgi:hypothetical protein